MAAPSGISAQFGYVSESTPGTPPTVTKFQPLVSESLKQDIAHIDSKGIRAGRRLRTVRRPGGKTVGGDINLELTNKDIATLLKHAFGAVSTSGAGPYVHTFTPGSLTGVTFACQIGRPSTDGTVNAFTYAGCKVTNGEITANAGDLVNLRLGVSAWTEVTNVALATASYTSGNLPFVFTEASLSVASSSVSVSNLSITWDNGLATDRFRLGSANVIEQLESGQRDYGGTATADFVSLTQYGRFTAASEVALVATFSNGTDSLVITTNVMFDGETPNVGGMELLTQPMPFKVLSSTADATAFTAVLTNGDSSAA
jgi:hypothetical protein